MNEPDGHQLAIAEVARRLSTARSVLVVTGAGISAESGLPTYRGVGGLYDVDTTSDGYAIEEILSGEMFRRDPELTWKYLVEVARACRGATFNRAHRLLAEMEPSFDRFWILTQNVDGLHRAAGSQQVIDIHGDLHDLVCTGCGWRKRIEMDAEFPMPPRCPDCHAVVRPDVVLFGEMLPARKTELLYREMRRGFDLVFSIGTSSLFPYISWPVEWAVQQGKPTVEINPGRSEVSSLVDIQLPLGAGEALEAICRAWRAASGASS